MCFCLKDICHWELWRRGETQTFMSFMVLLNTSAQFTILPGPMWGGKEAQALLKLLETELERAGSLSWGVFQISEVTWGKKQPWGLNPAVEGAAVGEEKSAPASESLRPFPQALLSSLQSSPGVSSAVVAVTVAPDVCLLENLVVFWKGKRYLNSTGRCEQSLQLAN